MPGISVVYIANGMNFPDALAGASTAGTLRGPVLLVQQNKIPAEVTAELKRLKPAKIVILGGTGVVSNNVKNTLEGKTPPKPVKLTPRQLEAQKFAQYDID